MRRRLWAAGFAALCVAIATAVAWRGWHPGGIVPSPYVPELASPVRGLSAQEVDDLLNGRGAGYARTAELNGYPGPRHMAA
jgi:hypothetical protein